MSFLACLAVRNRAEKKSIFAFLAGKIKKKQISIGNHMISSAIWNK